MGCCVAVPQDHIYLVGKCNNFENLAQPGFHCLGLPCICSVTGKANMRLRQLHVPVETKTKDDVFVCVKVAVQYKIKADRVYEAFYTLDDPLEQIRAYVFDIVRAAVPKMSLDDAFVSKDDIAKDVLHSLIDEMGQYGFEIVDALLIEITPDVRVVKAMNQINANVRLRVAIVEKAEAAKIQITKAAEAEAESKYLDGVGVARQRKAIAEGLCHNLGELHSSIKMDKESVMELLMAAQYFDLLKDIAKQKDTQAVFYLDEADDPHMRLQEDIRIGTLQGTSCQ